MFFAGADRSSADELQEQPRHTSQFSPAVHSPSVAPRQLLASYVKQQLQAAGLEKAKAAEGTVIWGNQTALIAEKVREIIEICGFDVTSDDLVGTPERVAKLLSDNVLWGMDYDNFPEISYLPEAHVTTEPNVVSKIRFTSCCRHHILPFSGFAMVAYRSKKVAIGLSKFHRIVNFFARRLQTQEHLTKQIHSAVSVILQTEDVLVVLQAKHMCIAARGVKDDAMEFTTTKSSGFFIDRLTQYLPLLAS